MTVDGVIVTPEERKGVQEHYEARLAVMDRYSDRQLQELKRQLEGERKLTEDEKKPYIKKIQDRIYEGRVRELQEKADACEGKNYTLTKRVLEEVEAGSLGLWPKKLQPQALCISVRGKIIRRCSAEGLQQIK